MLVIKKSQILLLFILIVPILTGCNQQTFTNTGGYSDISLNRNSSEYEIKHLKEVEASGNAIFGIPYSKNPQVRNKSGFIFRLNGLNIYRVRKVFPILTLLSTTILTGYYLETEGGYTYNFSTGKMKAELPWYFGSLLALPVTGIANNWMWGTSALANSLHEINYQLVTQNPEIDVFTNPKYVMENRIGIWTQTANSKVNVLGSKIKTERVIIQKP